MRERRYNVGPIFLTWGAGLAGYGLGAGVAWLACASIPLFLGGFVWWLDGPRDEVRITQKVEENE